MKEQSNTRKIYSMIIKKNPQESTEEDSSDYFYYVVGRLGAWAARSLDLRNDAEQANTTDTYSPLQRYRVCSKKNDSLAEAQKLADGLSIAQKNPADNFYI